MSPRGRRVALGAGAVVSALLALGALRSRRAARRTQERYPPLGELVDIDGARVHLLRRGDGDGLPVVLIHGADGVLLGWTETVLDRLAEDGPAIAVDRPAHGWSVVPRRTRRDLALNVRLLRAALARVDVPRAVLVGHSYGCAVALRWTLDHPEEVAGLVLLSPAAYNEWGPWVPFVTAAPAIPVLGPALSASLLPWLGPPVLRSISRRVGFAPNPVPPAYAAYSRAFYLRPTQFAALAEEYRHLRRDLLSIETRYGEIEVPARVLVGEEDRLTSPELQAGPLARALRHARLEVLPGVGHELPWDAGEAVVRAVREVRQAADDKGRDGSRP